MWNDLALHCRAHQLLLSKDSLELLHYVLCSVWTVVVNYDDFKVNTAEVKASQHVSNCSVYERSQARLMPYLARDMYLSIRKSTMPMFALSLYVGNTIEYFPVTGRPTAMTISGQTSAQKMAMKALRRAVPSLCKTSFQIRNPNAIHGSRELPLATLKMHCTCAWLFESDFRRSKCSRQPHWGG